MENNERYELCKSNSNSIIAAWAVSFMGVAKVQAQEFKVQGDLVSSYVWRGFYQTGVSFQPTLGFGIGAFVDGMELYRFRRNKLLGR